LSTLAARKGKQPANARGAVALAGVLW